MGFTGLKDNSLIGYLKERDVVFGLELPTSCLVEYIEGDENTCVNRLFRGVLEVFNMCLICV